MGGYSFGNRFNELFMTQTGNVMTLFFVLSGFSLFMANNKYDLFCIEGIKHFYKKRMINILPVYYLVHFLWVLFIEEDIIKSIMLTPVELLGIQSIFNSLFGVLHNRGTWFISCLVIDYLVYPFIQEIIKKMTLKYKVLLFGMVLLMSTYLPYINNWMGCESLYSNPFYRFTQFFLGVCLFSIFDKEILNSKKRNTILPLLVGLVATFMVILSTYKNIVTLQVLSLLFICVIILFATQIDCRIFGEFKFVKYLSKLTYGFYILQLFLWSPSWIIVAKLGLEKWKYKVIIPFFVLVIITILVHELYEKPVQKQLKKIFVSDC